MLIIFGAVAELEREYILQRQREGIEIVKARGVWRLYFAEELSPSICAEYFLAEKTKLCKME